MLRDLIPPNCLPASLRSCMGWKELVGSQGGRPLSNLGSVSHGWHFTPAKGPEGPARPGWETMALPVPLHRKQTGHLAQGAWQQKQPQTQHSLFEGCPEMSLSLHPPSIIVSMEEWLMGSSSTGMSICLPCIFPDSGQCQIVSRDPPTSPGMAHGGGPQTLTLSLWDFLVITNQVNTDQPKIYPMQIDLETDRQKSKVSFNHRCSLNYFYRFFFNWGKESGSQARKEVM